MTELINSCKNADYESCKLLIQLKANINEHYSVENGWSYPIIFTVRIGSISICKLLLENRAIIDVTDSRYMTALLYSVPNNYFYMNKLLIKYKANVNHICQYVYLNNVWNTSYSDITKIGIKHGLRISWDIKNNLKIYFKKRKLSLLRILLFYL